jgi:hypothetical protein
MTTSSFLKIFNLGFLIKVIKINNHYEKPHGKTSIINKNYQQNRGNCSITPEILENREYSIVQYWQSI